MNLRQLEVFLSVVDHGSFSAAARESLLTQSTVSQHIAGLEEELGVQLLERSRNGIRLTDGGKVLRKHARNVVGELRSTEAAFRRLRGLEDTMLRLAASTIPGGYLVPPVLARLCERFPLLDVVMIQGDSRETAERIASREVEVGVVGNCFEERGFSFAAVGQDRLCLVVPAGHVWAGRSVLSVTDLYDGVFVVRGAGSGTGKTVSDSLRAAGVSVERLRVRAEIGGSEAIKAAVLSGVGVAFLSDLAVRRDVERGDLIVVPVRGLAISRPFFLARRSGRELSPAATAFWDLMLATYPMPAPA